MNRRKATLGVAGVGVIAGVAGIIVLASPAGAGQAPTLPATTPQALVQSVLTTKAPAMAGTVEIDNNLGLAAVPGIPQLANGTSQLRVWSDGKGHDRLSIPSGDNEQTYVDDGTTLYQWDSATKTVHEETPGASGKTTEHARPKGAPQEKAMDPATAAKELVQAVQNYSTVTVQGTDTVAGRPAYDLVLTPKPSQHTLLRQVRIAIDATQHLPLQLTVLGNNSSTPAIQLGFNSIDFSAQPASLFTFTPPPGSKVVKDSGKDATKSEPDAQAVKPKLVGSGWDTVVIATLPTTSGSDQSAPASGSSEPAMPGMVGSGSASSGGSHSMNLLSMVRRIGTPVSGAWGSGWAIHTDVATAIITSDGRIAAGLVPEQVLTQALGSSK